MQFMYTDVYGRGRIPSMSVYMPVYSLYNDMWNENVLILHISWIMIFMPQLNLLPGSLC